MFTFGSNHYVKCPHFLFEVETLKNFIQEKTSKISTSEILEFDVEWQNLKVLQCLPRFFVGRDTTLHRRRTTNKQNFPLVVPTNPTPDSQAAVQGASLEALRIRFMMLLSKSFVSTAPNKGRRAQANSSLSVCKVQRSCRKVWASFSWCTRQRLQTDPAFAGFLQSRKPNPAISDQL